LNELDRENNEFEINRAEVKNVVQVLQQQLGSNSKPIDLTSENEDLRRRLIDVLHITDSNLHFPLLNELNQKKLKIVDQLIEIDRRIKMIQ